MYVCPGSDLEFLMRTHAYMWAQSSQISRFPNCLRKYHVKHRVCTYKHNDIYVIVAKDYPYLSAYSESKEGASWIVFDYVSHVVAHSRLEGDPVHAAALLSAVSNYDFYEAAVNSYPGFGFPRIDEDLVHGWFDYFPEIEPFPEKLESVKKCKLSEVRFKYKGREVVITDGDPVEFGFDYDGADLDSTKLPELRKTVGQRPITDPQFRSLLCHHYEMYDDIRNPNPAKHHPDWKPADPSKFSFVRRQIFYYLDGCSPEQLEYVKSTYGDLKVIRRQQSKRSGFAYRKDRLAKKIVKRLTCD